MGKNGEGVLQAKGGAKEQSEGRRGPFIRGLAGNHMDLSYSPGWVPLAAVEDRLKFRGTGGGRET